MAKALQHMIKTNGGGEELLPESSAGRVEHEFSNEIATHERKPNWIAEKNGLIGCAWIGRFWKLADTNYQFEERDVFFLIKRDGRRLAAGNLTVWRGTYDEHGYGWDLDEFVERADISSQSDYETALAVARIWGTDDQRRWWTDEPFCFGDLCSFNRLVIEAKTSSDVESSWQTIDALLKRIRRRLAVMVLKAFPLEYEGKVTEETRPEFARRQRALSRLYHRRLGAEPVPHKELAEAGWMLRLFNDGARPRST
jgi:hypothetical protein